MGKVWGPNRSSQICKAERVKRAEELFLDGFTKSHVATVLGVGWDTVRKYEKEILARRREEDVLAHEDKRRTLVASQLELARKAITEFHRSKSGEETIVTKVVPTACKRCQGSGFDDSGNWCPECDGDGEIVSEVVTRTFRGTCGDVSYLNAARECFREISRLEGIPAPASDRKAELHIHQGPNLSGAPDDMILQALELFGRIEQAARSEAKALDVESTLKEERDSYEVS